MFERLAAKRCGGTDLATIVGPELMLEEASKRFLEVTCSLAERVSYASEAIKLLSRARDERTRRKGTIKDPNLQIRDVEVVLGSLESRSEKRRRMAGQNEDDGTEVEEEVLSE